MSLQPAHDLGECLRYDTAVNDKGLTGIAHAQPLCLGIFNDLRRHADICGCVYIYVTVACSRLDHGNRAVLDYICDKSRAAPWDENIDAAVHFHHLTCNFAARIFHKKDQILTELFLAKRTFDRAHDGLIGMDRVAPSAQDRRVSRLKAQAERVCRHVGTGFVNNTDNTERHSLLSDPKSVGTRFHIQHFPDRIVKRRYLPQAFRHIRDPFFRKGKTVDQRLFDSLCLCRLDIFRVFFQYHLLLGDQFLRHRKKSPVLIRRSKFRRLNRGSLCPVCEHLHV